MLLLQPTGLSKHKKLFEVDKMTSLIVATVKQALGHQLTA